MFPTKSFSTVILLLSIFFLSACVSRDVRTDANSGLAINHFFADPEKADSGEIFTVYMEVENVGGRTANSILLELISSAFEGQGIEPQPGVIKIGQPLPEFRATRTERNYYFQRLSPPKTEFNQPGDFRVVSWLLQAPYMPEGTVKDFRLLGRLTYEYSTSSVINIPVYTKNEFRQRADANSLEITNTNGPLKIEITGPPQIVVNTDPDAISINKNEVVVYTITARNTGDGIPVTSGINGLVTGVVQFSGGITPLQCLPQGKTYEIIPLPPVSRSSQPAYDPFAYRVNLPADENGMILRDGQSVTFSCMLGLARDQWISRPFGTATISFDMNYIYFIEKEATVTVTGIRT